MADVPPDPALRSLPGSNDGRKKIGVTTSDLMPVASKFPGSSPKVDTSSIPPPELLGSGSKIPESYESRMRSQFTIPDPAIYRPKKQVDNDSGQQASWWSTEARPAMLNCTPYKTGGTIAPDSKDKSVKAEKIRAETIAKEKVEKAKEQKALMDQKDFLLRRYTSGPQLGGQEAFSVMGQVSEINKQLGLPASDYGRWNIKIDQGY